MKRPFDEFRRIVVTGVDGSGKSTTAKEAARQLSEVYCDSDIRVADSTGITRFRGGEPIHQTAPWLIELEPTEGQSKIRTLGQLGLFTAFRQLAELGSYRPGNLTIGVRDPYRVDPATYASIYGPSRLQAMTPEQRLKVFNRTTLAPHPAAFIHLRVDAEKAVANTAERETICPHETAEAMAKLSLELTSVLKAYESLYERPATEVAALTPRTIDDTAAIIEELLPSARHFYRVPTIPTTEKQRQEPQP